MNPVLRYFGSKHKASKWLMPNMPDHTVYCEPYGGSAGLLLNKPRCQFEYYNELNPRIYNLFKVIKNRRSMLHLCQMIGQIVWDKPTWQYAYEVSTDSIEDAAHVLIRSWMSFSPIGIFRNKSGYRDGAYDKNQVTQGHQKIWAALPKRIQGMHQRIESCHLSNLDARVFIDQINERHGCATFYYVDPPYVHSTRNETKRRGMAQKCVTMIMLHSSISC